MSEPTNPDELSENELDQVAGGTNFSGLSMGGGASMTMGSDASMKPPIAPQSGPQPGLYVQVTDGMIHVSNPSGTNNFAPGQFGYVGNGAAPPIAVPTGPGLQFIPPSIVNTTKP